MAADLEALRRVRGTYKASLTRLATFAKTCAENVEASNHDEIKIKLNRASELMNLVVDIERDIFKLNAEEPSIMDSIEDNYYLILTQLTGCVRKKSIAENVQLNNTTSETTLNKSQFSPVDIRLPKINIPFFDGNYLEWQSFYDIYCTTIHEKENLTPCQKFQYLKSFLKGDALALVRNLNVTDANYLEAFQKLCKRYDRKRHSVSAYMNLFLGQPNLHQANATSIRKLADITDEVMRGLKALGPNAESRDPWLLHLLVNKLDPETKGLWAQDTAEKDFPQLSELLEFLSKRSDALESLKGADNLTSKRPAQRSHVLTTNITPAASCSICAAEHYRLIDCPQFKSMSPEERSNKVKEIKRCFNCLGSSHRVNTCNSRARCLKCQRRHHTMLHVAADTNSNNTNPQTKQAPSETKTMHLTTTSEPSTATYCTNIPNTVSAVVLPTAMIHIQDAFGKQHRIRALMDSASQGSFISEKIFSILNLTRLNGRVLVSGLSNTVVGQARGKSIITISSVDDENFEIKVEAFILPRLHISLPEVLVDKLHIDKLKNLKLADDQFYKANQIDILLGADVFFRVIRDGANIEISSELTALNTCFGYIIAGRLAASEESTVQNCNILVNIDRTLRRFWEVEDIPENKHLEHDKCEILFKNSTLRANDGRFIVKFPYNESKELLGSTYNTALRRLQTVEARFKRDPCFENLYKSFMLEYFNLGHMSLVEPHECRERYYLPHHGVLKDSSSTTKLRVVFDGSAKSTTGIALNEILAVGPNVQQTLFFILVRFRSHQFVACGDLEKMYRQIWLSEEDNKLQNILWRSSSSQPVQTYQLNTVTYGTSPAAFLATRSLVEIANRIETHHPRTASIIRHDFYIDDMLTGSSNVIQLQKSVEEVKKVLAEYGFNLRKIVSNVPTVEEIATKDNTLQRKQIVENHDSAKILGLYWNPTNDCFSYSVTLDEIPRLTKRYLLSESSKLFDPLGLLAPIIIRVKILFQELWRRNIEWDEQLPKDIKNSWQKIRLEVMNVDKVIIPRWLNTHNFTHLHGFCDSSSEAYAAAIYAVIPGSQSRLVAAKSKVAPIKPIHSIPRLELLGAVLLSKLMESVTQALQIGSIKIYMWTDSSIVLDWLATSPRNCQNWVANRTSVIQTKYPRNVWRHVPTSSNPADVATRGMNIVDLNNCYLWWLGPNWLPDEQNWPKQIRNANPTQEEMKLTKHVFTTVQLKPFILGIVERYNSFRKMRNVMGYILRYIHNLRTSRCNKDDRIIGVLNRAELIEAENHILRAIQSCEISTELTQLRQQSQISSKSKLINLNPFIDHDGLLRVGGRIQRSILPFIVKHPVILLSTNVVSRAIANDLHNFHHHPGPGLLTNLIRRHYWIVRCKNLARSVAYNCINCIHQRPILQKQLMGNLPERRVQFSFPFRNSAVDFCGPFKVQMIRRRGQHPQDKVYVCIFVCCGIKAVHIEVCYDLSTDSFLGALKRFIARRGICDSISSDNGTNFVGANNFLKTLYTFIKANNNNIASYLNRFKIEWRFNPPNSPHMGGLWEAAVKQAKVHMKRVIGDHILTMEEFQTLITQIESTLNSRPLATGSSDEIDVITPAHFLIGRTFADIPDDPDFSSKSIKGRWHVTRKMFHDFWKRWHFEYLITLQRRNKWCEEQRSLEKGDVVLVAEPNTLPNNWPLGKIVEVHPGQDGKARVVTVQMANSKTQVRRSIHRMAKIPINIIESSDSMGGGNVDDDFQDLS